MSKMIFAGLALFGVIAQADHYSINCDLASTWQFFPRLGQPHQPFVAKEKLTGSMTSYMQAARVVYETSAQITDESGNLNRSYTSEVRTQTQPMHSGRERDVSEVSLHSIYGTGQQVIENYMLVIDYALQADGTRKRLRVFRDNVDVTARENTFALPTINGWIDATEDLTVRSYQVPEGVSRQLLNKQICTYATEFVKTKI